MGFKDQDTMPNVLAALTIELDLSLYKTEWRLENSVFVIAGLVGGFALLVWLLFFILDHIVTISKFKNYMASELYTVDENELKDLTSTRGPLPRGFHNEIITDKGRVLNLRKDGRYFCCGRSGKIFAKARSMTSEELNVSSIIKA
jgi:hypothetical protein